MGENISLSYNELLKQLTDLQKKPPWEQIPPAPGLEGAGAPYPGEYNLWQEKIRILQAEINALLQINRP